MERVPRVGVGEMKFRSGESVGGIFEDGHCGVGGCGRMIGDVRSDLEATENGFTGSVDGDGEFARGIDDGVEDGVRIVDLEGGGAFGVELRADFGGDIKKDPIPAVEEDVVVSWGQIIEGNRSFGVGEFPEERWRAIGSAPSVRGIEGALVEGHSRGGSSGGVQGEVGDFGAERDFVPEITLGANGGWA